MSKNSFCMHKETAKKIYLNVGSSAVKDGWFRYIFHFTRS